MPDELAISAVELAERLGGELHGDAARVVSEVAALQGAGPQSLSWARDERHLDRVAHSRAGVVLIPMTADPVASTTCIRVRDAEDAVRRVLEWFAPPAVEIPTGVHPSAVVAESAVVDGVAIAPLVYVGPRARIGAGTLLHPGVCIEADVSIGKACVLWPNVVVRERITVGNHVVIHPNATIGGDGFGYIFRDGKHLKVPQIGGVLIEDDVEIGAGTTIDRAKFGNTFIGRGTKIDNLVQVAHNVTIGRDCIVVAQCAIGGSASLGRHVVMAGGAAAADHAQLGDGVQVTAMSGVSKNVRAGEIVRGIPAIPIRKFHRQQAALRKLPEWIERIRALTKRVEELESAANH